MDECIGGIHDCSENANCYNTEGSYYCTCRDGFIGNGITCLSIIILLLDDIILSYCRSRTTILGNITSSLPRIVTSA